MKVCTLKNRVISIFSVLLIWFILSKIYSPVVVPSISQVSKVIVKILSNVNGWNQIFITLLRLFLGFFYGIILAIVFCILMIHFKFLEEIFYPIIQFLQVIPPISWLILAILWLGLNGKPAIFIVSISIFSIMTISIMQSVKNIDYRYLQIGDVYKLSKKDTYRYILFPAIFNAFETSFIVSLSLGVKLIVMAEVLTIDSGIGAEIFNARINIETETVIAWTVIIIVIYFILGGIFNWLKKIKIIRHFWYQKLLPKNMKIK